MMSDLSASDPVALQVIQAIQAGNIAGLEKLLVANPGLATVYLLGKAEMAAGVARSLLHVATDWPGHFPNIAATIQTLIAAGADPNACFRACSGGAHTETPLHWAASSDDIEALDALLDAGANIEAPGAVIGGGTPLADAVAFGQWKAAARLIERGAIANLWQAAALGLLGRVGELCSSDPPPSRDDITNAFWCACHGGQQGTAEFLLARGAELNWIGHDQLTPLDAALRSGAGDLAVWLRAQGATDRKP
jgi:ankyrin repeat protein